MKKIFIALIALLTSFIGVSQMNGVTATGDEVVLYGDGTWEYLVDSLNISDIKKNDTPFIRNKKSTFLVKSDKTNIGVYINPKKWSFTKAEKDSPAEITFNIKSKDLNGMLIAEKIEIPIENLIEIAFTNAKSVAPDTRVILKEYRNVNGLEVVAMVMGGTIQGIKFIYYGYYYSNSSGSFQFLTYTSESMFEESKKDMEELLNGIVER